MARTRLNAKGRRENGTYAGIPHSVTRSPQYAALSAHAVKLLLDFTDQFNGKNNGDMEATWPTMQRKGWRSKKTLYRAIRELTQAGFVVVSRQGWTRTCTLYALTFLAIDECRGKLDIAPTAAPYNTWKTKTAVPQVYQCARKVTCETPKNALLVHLRY